MDTLLEMFSFQGRANRSWYFWHTLLDGFIILALTLTMVVLSVLVGTPILLALPFVGLIIGGVTAAIAVTVKRLHDLDRQSLCFSQRFKL